MAKLTTQTKTAAQLAAEWKAEAAKLRDEADAKYDDRYPSSVQIARRKYARADQLDYCALQMMTEIDFG